MYVQQPTGMGQPMMGQPMMGQPMMAQPMQPMAQPMGIQPMGIMQPADPYMSNSAAMAMGAGMGAGLMYSHHHHRHRFYGPPPPPGAILAFCLCFFGIFALFVWFAKSASDKFDEDWQRTKDQMDQDQQDWWDRHGGRP